MIGEILEAKRDGCELNRAQIQAFVDGVVNGAVTRPQAAAFLAFVFNRGMTVDETVDLTEAMASSGTRLDWSGLEGPFVDKHSTGGVGDKVSLILAPLWAELGSRVPMISGRGLGHTGGTLDKLEAIPGFCTDLEPAALRLILDDVGCFISGQTGSLAPADRTLYALRNETSTVPSIPLITASILSKKLAEGIDELVLDVKWGSGAFMKTHAAATELADMLCRVGRGAGLLTRAVLTDMNQPLGRTVGNAIEVEESIACLKGEGPGDLAALTTDLIGDPRAKATLSSGAAYERFCRMVHAQGGDLNVRLHGAGCKTLVIESQLSGMVTKCDALAIGRAVFVLGAGRAHASAAVHPGVGLTLHKKIGENVEAGEPLVTLRVAEKGVDEAKALVEGAYGISAS
jgi:pyrimidine-nucleoside phosphorylase